MIATGTGTSWLTQLMGRSQEQLAELLAAGVVQTGR